VSNALYRFRDNRVTPILTWDVFGYYLYLPAFFYDDPAKLNNIDYMLQNYNPGGFYQAGKAPNGNYIMKYSCGQAIMYLPAFVCAHLVAKIFDYPADGLSFPYQAAINFESLLVACIGLWLLRKILKKYFADHVVAAVLIIIGLASNYFQYATFANAFTHNYLFALYGIIILLSIQWHSSPRYSTSIALGFCCGLAALTRPTEMITVLIPLLWGVHDRASISKKFLMLKKEWKMMVCFCIAAFLIGSIQLVYWKVYAGSWLYFSYGDNQTFSWLKPHVWNVLMSYQKGWLVYTPVMILSLIGFFPLYKNHREHFFTVLIYILVFFYFVSSWDSWLYGGSFSMRAMIQSYPILAFPLASSIEWISMRKISIAITTIFIVVCIWLNAVMSYQAFFSWQGIMDGYNMNAKYYWRVFGKTKINIDDRKFLDTNEELPSALQDHLKGIYFNDFEEAGFPTDSSQAFSGKHSFLLTEQQQELPIRIPVNASEQCWYRVSAKVYPTEMEWDESHQAQMVIGLWNDNTMLKQKFFRIYRVASPGSWQNIYLDINGAVTQPYDSLSVSMRNAGGKRAMYIDDIQIAKVPAE